MHFITLGAMEKRHMIVQLGLLYSMNTHAHTPLGFTLVNFNPGISLPLNAVGRLLHISCCFNMNMGEKCEGLAVRYYRLLKKRF